MSKLEKVSEDPSLIEKMGKCFIQRSVKFVTDTYKKDIHHYFISAIQ